MCTRGTLIFQCLAVARCEMYLRDVVYALVWRTPLSLPWVKEIDAQNFVLRLNLFLSKLTRMNNKITSVGKLSSCWWYRSSMSLPFARRMRAIRASVRLFFLGTHIGSPALEIWRKTNGMGYGNMHTCFNSLPASGGLRLYMPHMRFAHFYGGYARE